MTGCELYENCPLATEFSLLQQRVSSLEEGQEEVHKFKEKFYDDQRDRIKRDAEIDMTLRNINEKLDKLISWQNEQINKPIRRFDGIIDKTIFVCVGALVGYFMSILLPTF